MACSDPPTYAQRNRNAHALLVHNCVAIVEKGQLVAMVASSGHGLLFTSGLTCACNHRFQSERVMYQDKIKTRLYIIQEILG